MMQLMMKQIDKIKENCMRLCTKKSMKKGERKEKQALGLQLGKKRIAGSFMLDVKR